MRFKATINNAGSVSRLADIVQTVARLSPKWVLRLTPTALHFVLPSEQASGVPRVWSQLTLEGIFETWRIESKHPNNEIFLELSAEELCRALRSVQPVDSATLKIVKRDNVPALEITELLPLVSGRSASIMHLVPVVILKHDLGPQFAEPCLPDPQVCIFLPSSRLFRSVVERYRAMGNFVELSANSSGELAMSMNTDIVSVATHFKDLRNPRLFDDRTAVAPSAHPPHHMYSVRIDVRLMAPFIVGIQTAASNVACNIIQDRAVILILAQEDITLTYYIPAVCL